MTFQESFDYFADKVVFFERELSIFVDKLVEFGKRNPPYLWNVLIVKMKTVWLLTPVIAVDKTETISSASCHIWRD